MTKRSKGGARVALLGFLASLAASGAVWAQVHSHGAAAPAHQTMGAAAPAHQHMDARFGHNQYYFDHGYSIHQPPRGGYAFDRGRDHYWYHGGHWYRRGSFGWAVDGAPLGAFIWFLPPYYTTVWFAGVPYYYANDTYYTWDGDAGQYEVVPPPADIESGTTQPPLGDTLFVYPKNGQTAEQQAQDRFECYQSAVGNSGYDPTLGGGGVPANIAGSKRADYLRAESACLDARSYSVK